MRNILSELGFVYKKPKLISNNSDPLATMKYLQRYEEIRRSGLPQPCMTFANAYNNQSASIAKITKKTYEYQSQ